jgi:iron uptake system component EfeO
MRAPALSSVLAGFAMLSCVVLAAGCSSSDNKAAAGTPASGTQQIAVSLTNDGCDPVDPAIDARADDVPVDQLTGFHRIEYELWEKNSTDGMLPVADQLLANVTKLRDESPTLPLDALQLANGANELLGEVSTSKITGEEERYSHIDLVDFEANVEGSKAAFDAVRAALVRRDPDLATTIDQRFAAVTAALAPYRTGDTFVLYTALTSDDTRKLSQVIDALGEPLSEVAAKLGEPVA